MSGVKGMERTKKLRTLHQEDVRKKIRVSLIVKRLQDHIDGKKEMNASQVTAAKILLDKTMSNAPTDINANIDATILTFEERLAELDAK